eukprot:TRINITY_DN4325_c0_g1_i1.p1 TRINITY_DN4325_c0_g1~~TRINITY_DN4325_c0_g1_i1.p1  ORF type:complete len:204 (+),score=34.36 TRINITY_DN4325_c0_g1_i1:39-614(+)
MAAPLNILAISGSLRRASTNTGLLRAAAKLAPAASMTVEVFDLNGIPLFNQDFEDDKTIPERVIQFRAKVQAADGILIACPEYNYSMSGPLKNALDWASRTYDGEKKCPISGKPTALVGSGGGLGTARSQSSFLQTARFLDLAVLSKPEVLVKRWGSPDMFDDKGDLLDKDTEERLAQLLTAFEALTRRYL